MNTHIFLVLSVFLFSCSKQHSINHLLYEKSKLDNQCYIDSYKGINGIELGLSNLEDVKKVFGEDGIESTSKLKGSFPYMRGVKFKILTYEDLGLIFSTSAGFLKRHHGEKVWKIYLNENCECKTKEGIGIGSSFEQIKNALGSPTGYFRWNLVNGKSTNMSYLYNSDDYKLEFYSSEWRDSSEFIAERINLIRFY